jgi:hypothetical protein
MSLEKSICRIFVVKCRKCGCEDRSTTSQKAVARMAFVRFGWRTVNGLPYCPVCAPYIERKRSS